MKDYPVAYPIKIEWNQMDALGHVNNAIYFKYFEAARIEYFMKIGQKELQAGKGQGPVLAQIACQFMLPVSFPDDITVGCWIERIGNTSVQMNYEIYSKKLDAVAARGESVVVMIDYSTGKKAPIPEAIKSEIYNIQPELKA